MVNTAVNNITTKSTLTVTTNSDKDEQGTKTIILGDIYLNNYYEDDINNNNTTSPA